MSLPENKQESGRSAEDDVCTYKTVCIRFSKNDYKILDRITTKENRTKTNAIKHAMRVYAENL